MASSIERFLDELPWLGPIWNRHKYPLKRLLRYHLHRQNRRDWEPRIRDVMACDDNRWIPRVADAGQLRDGHVVMHNGLQILPGSYYGEPMRLLLERNRGVHEPQEERVFQEVLTQIGPGATMLELGAYWGFYSMWFQQRVPNARSILVEPMAASLEAGQRNFALNHLSGEFIQAYVGGAPGRTPDGSRVVTVDELMAERGIAHLQILHADVQGAERDMLDGARATLRDRRVDYVFVSTHSDTLHQDSRQRLLDERFTILADANMQESYSYDGLLVARRQELPGLEPIAIDRKPH